MGVLNYDAQTRVKWRLFNLDEFDYPPPDDYEGYDDEWKDVIYGIHTALFRWSGDASRIVMWGNRYRTYEYQYTPCNMDQKLIRLSWQTVSSTRVSVAPPFKRCCAPPGNYLLFAVDNTGSYSTGRWVHINLPPMLRPGAGVRQ